VARRGRAVVAFTVLIAVPAAAQSPLLISAGDAVPGLVVDMRYAGSHNFTGAPVDGYVQPVCLLTGPAVAALSEVQRGLARRGLGVKMFDCYRPARAVARFMRWAEEPDDPRAKAEFYPVVNKRDLVSDGYIAARSSHSRGSTVDLTLVRLTDGAELDMGTPFDRFSPQSWPTDASVGTTAQANRRLLAAAMRAAGFVPYAKEWWHFTLRHEPFPRANFDLPVR
jgi:D-alanyl-D-alanine dipeptidase